MNGDDRFTAFVVALAGALVAALLTGCAAAQGGTAGPASAGGTTGGDLGPERAPAVHSPAARARLSRHEYDLARGAVARTIRRQDARLKAATVEASRGVVTREQPNTAHACTSGRLLHVELIGDFPHIVTGGPEPGAPAAPDVVHAVLLTLDANTGRSVSKACGRAIRSPRVTPSCSRSGDDGIVSLAATVERAQSCERPAPDRH